jgi:hypothetical protein
MNINLPSSKQPISRSAAGAQVMSGGGFVWVVEWQDHSEPTARQSWGDLLRASFRIVHGARPGSYRDRSRLNSAPA